MGGDPDPRPYRLSDANLVPSVYNLQTWRYDLTMSAQITLYFSATARLSQIDTFGRQTPISFDG